MTGQTLQKMIQTLLFKNKVETCAKEDTVTIDNLAKCLKYLAMVCLFFGSVLLYEELLGRVVIL